MWLLINFITGGAALLRLNCGCVVRVVSLRDLLEYPQDAQGDRYRFPKLFNFDLPQKTKNDMNQFSVGPPDMSH